MAHSSYADLLRDPRWQKKRLEILERDGWTCEQCEGSTKTLHVHHSYYEKGLKPWEYPEESLHTLCEDCHKIAQELLAVLQREIGLTELENIVHAIGYLRRLRSSNPESCSNREILKQELSVTTNHDRAIAILMQLGCGGG